MPDVAASGNVEVDETFTGGVKQGSKRGRGSAKSIVVIAIEILDPKGFGGYGCVIFPMLQVKA